MESEFRLCLSKNVLKPFNELSKSWRLMQQLTTNLFIVVAVENTHDN